mmetsp:Transcript_838/g.1138  ORF Transcript_838/g.1138 Transcript_838/m.1138 type:complete len:1008 (-) Transcript_838:79-3102(-)
MDLTIASGGSGGGSTTSVLDPAGSGLSSGAKASLETGKDVGVSTHVHMLLLRPNDLSIRITTNFTKDKIEGERSKLFNTDDGNIILLVFLFTSGMEVIEDLTRAEDNTLLLGLLDRVEFTTLGHNASVIGDDTLEADTNDTSIIRLIIKVGKRGLASRVTEKVLRTHDNKRLTELAVDLTTKAVEVIGGSSAVDNLPVAGLNLVTEMTTGEPFSLINVGEDEGVFVTHLEETLKTGTRVLRALTIIPVRQHAYKTTLTEPLGLTGAQELIKDNLGAVGEVTELGLPHDERVGVLHGVTKLITEDTELTEVGVGNGELTLSLIRVDMVKRNILLTVILIVDNGMTVAEGTTLDILTRKTDVVTLGKESREGHGFSHSPIEASAGLDHLATKLIDLLELTMSLEVLRELSDGLTNALENIHANTSVTNAGELKGRLETRPIAAEPILGLRLVALGGLEVLIEDLSDGLVDLGDLFLSSNTGRNKLLNVAGMGRLVLLDGLVHKGLSKHRLINLIVTVLAVADDIDDDIRVPLGAPLGSKIGDANNTFNIITVDVEDRAVQGLGNVRAVGAAAAILGVSGKSDLVVDNDMNGTANRVVRKSTHSKGLIDNTLSRKGTITMEKDGERFGVFSIIAVELLGTNFPKDNSVNSLKMTGVGNKGKMNALAIGGGAIVTGTKMVLDVTTTNIFIRIFVNNLTGEFTENLRHGLTNNVGEDIETTTMGHTDDDILNSEVSTGVNHGLNTRNHALGTLKTKTLGGREFVGEESFKHVGPSNTVKDVEFLLLGVSGRINGFNSLTDPVALVTIGNMHILITNATAVSLLQALQNLTESTSGATFFEETRLIPVANEELPIEVSFRKTVRGGVKFGRNFAVLKTKRVKLGSKVTRNLVSPDEHNEAHRLLNSLIGDVGSTLESGSDTLLESTVSLGNGLTGNATIKTSEERGPGFVDAVRILAVSLLKLLKIVHRGAIVEAVLKLRKWNRLISLGGEGPRTTEGAQNTGDTLSDALGSS